MATKFNWGHGLTLALLAFVIFISYFVYKTLAKPEYDHKLVSDEYYKEEMYFQEEMDRLKNAEDLKENVEVIVNDDGVVISFPEIFKPEEIKGTYLLQRTNNDSLDVKGDIKLNSSDLYVPKDILHKGRYNVKLIWEYDNIPYQINKKITF